MKYKDIFQTLFLPVIILVALMHTSILAATKPASSDQFTAKVHAYKNVVINGRGDWLSPPSPWIIYIDRQFWHGLSPARQKQYLAFQTKGPCEAVVKLEQTGFLNLYPELSQALSDKVVNDIFTHEIVPLRSFGARRCQAYALLNPIIENEKKLDANYYYLTIPGTDLGHKLERIYDPREIVLRKAFTILYDLAACHDYKPAIKDILEFNKLYLIFAGYYEQYYFYARAKHYGLEAPDAGIVLEEMRRNKSPFPYPQDESLLYLYEKYNTLHETRLNTIRLMLANDNLDAARKIVFKLTYISCGKSKSE